MNTESGKKWKDCKEKRSNRSIPRLLSKVLVCHVVDKEINDTIPATFDIQLKKKAQIWNVGRSSFYSYLVSALNLKMMLTALSHFLS